MFVPALSKAPEPNIRPGHMTLKDSLERTSRDLLALLQPKRRQASPIPAAHLPVLERLRPCALAVTIPNPCQEAAVPHKIGEAR